MTLNWKLLPVAFLSMLLGGLLAMAYVASRLPQANPNAANNTAIGRAAIGGPFTLVNQKGDTVSEKNLLGKYSLVYFGFTFCPDICPSELQVMAAAMEELDPAQSAKITPFFVSIDPERDTPEKMGEYVANFHPRMVGLTGSVEQVKQAAKAYKVYYKKQKDPNSSAAYTMDHSSIIYLMGPDGYFLKHFSYGTGAKKIAKYLKKNVR